MSLIFNLPKLLRIKKNSENKSKIKIQKNITDKIKK
jgi:hypothetical protein